MDNNKKNRGLFAAGTALLITGNLAISSEGVAMQPEGSEEPGIIKVTTRQQVEPSSPHASSSYSKQGLILKHHELPSMESLAQIYSRATKQCPQHEINLILEAMKATSDAEGMLAKAYSLALAVDRQ